MRTFTIAALFLIMLPGPTRRWSHATPWSAVGWVACSPCWGVLGLTVHAVAAAVGLSALLVRASCAWRVQATTTLA